MVLHLQAHDLLEPFVGGWPEHAHRHCIWIVSPGGGYAHHHAFDEVAEALEEAFSQLGGSAPLARDPSEWHGRAPIVFGGNLLQHVGGLTLPTGSIIFNLEQVVPGCGWMNDKYLALLARYPVLDYSRRNIKALAQLGIGHARLLEIGHSPTLTRIARAEQDIDVLFYGWVSDRRLAVLQSIAATGLRVFSAYDLYGAARDEVIARAKVVVNIHSFEQNVFETVRVSYLLANKVCVVSEGQPDEPDLQWCLGGVELTSVEDMPACCLALVGHPPSRLALAEAGYERMVARPQCRLLQECMEAS